MRFLIEIALIIGVGFALLVLLGSQLSATAGKKARKIIMQIDKKYNEYIQKSLNLSVLKENNFDFDTEQIKKDVFSVLKPDLDALMSFIAATENASGVNIKYSSPYFQNLSSLAEKYFRITDERKSTNLEPNEIQEFYEALNSGISADLTKRILDLKTSGYSG